ncbi:MAG: glycoside hydrolase family 15 protein [Opitutaceae bacterium]
MPEKKTHAFGSPGAPARWSSSAKVGIGTAYHTGCCAWFTLSHGVVDEIYYPSIDVPNTRDLQLLITDGSTFCHEERRDLEHKVEMPTPGALFYRLTNTDRKGRYQIIKEVLTDPHRPVLLMRVKLRVLKPAWRNRLKVYALLAPHIGGQGGGNIARCCELSTGDLLHAHREETHLVFGCSLGFSRRSVGYVGASDGWRDLRNFKMDWEFREAGPGNVAMMGEIILDGRSEFTVGVGFGKTDTSAVTALLQSFAAPFSEHRAAFEEQWRRSDRRGDVVTRKATTLARVSRMVLFAHEDKVFQGAMVASLSIPWGESKGDDAKGGYHLVWTRDLVQSASALLAADQSATALRALIWLAAVQNDDGGMPQNSWTDGTAYRDAIQLDETASLLLLASRLREADALHLFNPWKVLKKATAYLIKAGPVTPQERWEETAGYSPSTLAAVIAGIAGAAEFANDEAGPKTREFILAYADWLNAYVEEWTVTTSGSVHPKIKRHYLRITPADPKSSELAPDPDHAEIQLANDAGKYPARVIVGGDFLQLVRLGLRQPADPLILDSLKVIDRVLKRKLPSGEGWRRYSHDGYGQKRNGEPFDGTGIGRCWPLLTGERGHHAIALGRNARPYLRMMEAAAQGFLLPEQIWDEPTSKDRTCRIGEPSGSAMPLCWSHAEYLTLARSQRDGRIFDRIEPAYRRYARNGGRTESYYEFWSLRYRRSAIKTGKLLRIVGDAPAKIRWATANPKLDGSLELTESGLDQLWFADLPISRLPSGSSVEFSFLGLSGWEGITFRITLQ